MIQFFRIFFSQLAVDWSCRTQMEAGTSDWIIPPWWLEIFVPKHSKTGFFSTNYFLKKKQGGFVLWTANNNKKQKLRTPPGGGLDHTFAATFGRGFFLRTFGGFEVRFIRWFWGSQWFGFEVSFFFWWSYGFSKLFLLEADFCFWATIVAHLSFEDLHWLPEWKARTFELFLL